MAYPSGFPTPSSPKAPYQNFQFLIKWADSDTPDSPYLAGFSTVSGLSPTTKGIADPSGATPLPAPMLPSFEPIILKQGITQDEEFEQWTNSILSQSTTLGDLADLRKDITIDVYNVAGQVVSTYRVYRCWPSVCVMLPVLDSSSKDMSIQSLTLQNEGWELLSGD